MAGTYLEERLHVHLTREVNGDINEGTRWGEISGESTIMSMESTEAKDIRVLEERAKVPVASPRDRLRARKIRHRVRVLCKNFLVIFTKKSFAPKFATFT